MPPFQGSGIFPSAVSRGVAPGYLMPPLRGFSNRLGRLRAKRKMKTETSSFEEIAAREERFQLATYKKFPFAPVRGQGSWVETSEGERYLDLYGGHAVCATGHCHPRVVEALKAQAGRLLFYSNVVYSDVRALAAEKLVGCAPERITKSFFCNSGTEANENAMRMARMKTGRERVITFDGSFHGRTADRRTGPTS